MTRDEARALARQALTEARLERIELVAQMRLWPGPDSVPLPGYITSRQAAERIGVSRRTIERYRATLRIAGECRRAGMLP
jgi:hypothetical protein